MTTPNLEKLDIDKWIGEAQELMDKVGLEPSRFEMVIMGYLCRICKELDAIQKKLEAMDSLGKINDLRR